MPAAVPAQPEPIYVRSLTAHGGMNNKDVPWNLPEVQSVLLQNLDVTKVGARRRRPGVSSIGALSLTPYGAWRSPHNVPADERLFTIYGGRLFMMQAAGVVTERACGASFVNALHTGIEGYYNSRLCSYITQAQVHDSDPTLTSKLTVLSDTNNFTQTASMAPRGIQWFQNRLWCVNNTFAGDTETLWWSALGDGISYSSTNTIRVEPGLGGRLQAILPVRTLTPGLLCFKERAIAVFQPYWGASSALIPAAADALDTIKSQVLVISANVGCAAALSVQYVPSSQFGDVLFLARDGIHSIARAQGDEISGVTPPISDPVKSTIDRINFTFGHKCTSAVVDAKYHLTLPLDGAVEATHVLSLDLVTGAWFLQDWEAKALVASRANGETSEKLWFQYNTQTADCSNSGTFTGYHFFKAYAGLLDPGGIPVVFQEETRGFTAPDLRLDQKNNWDQLVMVVKNETTETCVMALEYNIDQNGWATFASAAIGGTNEDPILGLTPLPWGSAPGTIRALRFSLADAQPGYEMQIRYTGQSDLSVPTILQVMVGLRPIQPEFDNEIA